MILVDDVLNINMDVPDVRLSHKNISAFSKMKRLPLGGCKCFILPVNLRKKDDTRPEGWKYKNGSER